MARCCFCCSGKGVDNGFDDGGSDERFPNNMVGVSTLAILEDVVVAWSCLFTSNSTVSFVVGGGLCVCSIVSIVSVASCLSWLCAFCYGLLRILVFIIS